MKSLLILCLVPLLAGCAAKAPISYQEIRQKKEIVDVSDGVDKQEAIIIAQNLLIDKGLGDRMVTLKTSKAVETYSWVKDNSPVNYVIPPNSDAFEKKLDKAWEVYFKDKDNNILRRAVGGKPFYVRVNSKSGKVEKWGVKE